MLIEACRNEIMWHWSYKSIPELSGLGNSQQRALWHAARRKAFDYWQTWLAEFAALGVAVIAIAIGVGLSATNSLPVILGGLVISTLLIGASALWAEQTIIQFARPYLRGKLGTHCANCDYDLRGNITDICPECGQRAAKPISFHPPAAAGRPHRHCE